MNKFDVIAQQPFFPMFDVVYRFPDDENDAGGNNTGTGDDDTTTAEKPVPDGGNN